MPQTHQYKHQLSGCSINIVTLPRVTVGCYPTAPSLNHPKLLSKTKFPTSCSFALIHRLTAPKVIASEIIAVILKNVKLTQAVNILNLTQILHQTTVAIFTAIRPDSKAFLLSLPSSKIYSRLLLEVWSQNNKTSTYFSIFSLYLV